MDSVKGLSGTAARKKLKELLHNFVIIEAVNEEEFKI